MSNIPCPFCGSKNLKPKADGDGGSWEERQVCFATGPAGSKYDGEEGEPYEKPLWGTRPEEERLKKRIAELKKRGNALADKYAAEPCVHGDDCSVYYGNECNCGRQKEYEEWRKIAGGTG